MIGLRRQLPVYSPLPWKALVAALSTGDARPALVAALREEYAASDVMLVDSGTSALRLAIQVAEARRPGAPVVLPSFGCFDLATAALGVDLPVVLYDIDPATFQPDTESLERAIASGPCAVVIVHHFGIPVPLERLRERLSLESILLIEDAAQAAGGRWLGAPLGSVGDLSVLSFGRGKGITGGGGGALLARFGAASVLTSVAQPVERPAKAGFFLKALAQWVLARPAIYGLPSRVPMLRLGETVFHAPWGPTAMSEASSRLLVVTRALEAREATVRRKTAARYRAALGAGAGAAQATEGGEGGYLRFPVLRADAKTRHAAALGIIRSYPISLGRLPALAGRIVEPSVLPGGERLARELWTVPTHSQLTEEEVSAIEAWLRE